MGNRNSLLSAIQARVASSYGEAADQIRNTVAAYRTLPPFKKAVVTGVVGAAAAVGLGHAALLGSVSAFAIQLLGLAGFALGQISAQNEHHRHILAQISVSCGLLTAQSILLKDGPGAAMLGHAMIFTAACSILPEEGYDRLKKGIVWGIGGIGFGLSAVFSGLVNKAYNSLPETIQNHVPQSIENFIDSLPHSAAAAGPALESLPAFTQEIINNIPTVTVLFNSYALSRPDAQTARARAFYMFNNAAHPVYFGTRLSAAMGILLTEGFFLANNMVAAYRFDIVKTDLEGNPLKWKDRLGIYFRKTLWNGELPSAHGLTPHALAKRAKTDAPEAVPA